MKKVIVFLPVIFIISTYSCRNSPKNGQENDRKISYAAFTPVFTFDSPHKDKGLNQKQANLIAATVIPTDRVFAGQGYNSATGEFMDDVVIDTPLVTTLPPSVSNKNGQHISLNFNYVETLKEVKRKMSLDVRASLKIGSFSGNMEIEQFNESFFNSYSCFFLISLKVTNPSLVIKKPRLNDSAKALLNDPVNFIGSFGDEYVNSIETGGSFYILYEFKTSSAQEQESVRKSLQAKSKGILWSANVKAETQQELSDLETMKSKSIIVTGSGICGKLPKFDLDSLSQYIVDFPDKVSLNNGCPSVISVSTVPLKPLDEIRNKSIFNGILEQQFFLEDCAEKVDDLNEALTNLKYINDNQNEFNAAEVRMIDFNTGSLNIQKNIKFLQRSAIRCARDLSKCDIMIDDIKVPNVKIPRNDGLMELLKPKTNIITGGLENSILIDSIQTDTKTYEFRGEYSMENDISNEIQFGNASSDFTIDQTAGGIFAKHSSLFLDIYEKGNLITPIESILITHRPITIFNTQVYLKIRFVVTQPGNPIDATWIKQHVKIKDTNPLSYISY